MQTSAAKPRNIKVFQAIEKFGDTLEGKIDFSQPFVNNKGEMVVYLENERGAQFDVHSFRRICHISCKSLISTKGVTLYGTCKNYEKHFEKN